MHMAAAGTYLGQLINATPFYVMKPPEGQAHVARRDIICFPTLGGTNFIYSTDPQHIDYILSKRRGTLQEFEEETGLREEYISTACELGMFGVKQEEGEWYLTSIGLHSFAFITHSNLWGQFGHLVQAYQNRDSDNRDDFDPSVM
jgi:hypothetical protein